MYLKKLMISGFKSFADPIELHFHSGTTAIVGPNGCGKSNVVDAFRWVLGERSAKELRGEEMMDVIFKGTPHRPPLSRAEVSLLFDNADGRLPVEFSEVEIARRLYRSGESEYLINKRRCRLKDVQALIADTGIGTEGYSVFEQGNVDAFLLSSPQERRKLFEEAAGISRFKKQRRKALSQLERVEANLTRLTDILAEVEKRVRSVKYQAGRARRFLKDRERMGRLRSVIAAAEIDELRRDREVISFRLSSTQVERGLIARLAARFERGRESARRGVESAGQTLASLRDEEMRLRVELERKQQRLSHIGERREEIGDATLKRKAMGQELQRVVEEYSGRRAEVRERIREEISRLRGARARFDEGEERRRSLSEEGSRLDHHIRTAKEEALSQVFTQTRLSNEEISQKSDLRGLDALRERRIREREEFEAQLRELKGAREGLTRGLHETREGAAVAARRLALLEGEVESRSRTLDEKKQALSALNASLEGCGARLRFLEGLEASREGVGKGAQRLLSLDHPISAEVVGLLAGCIEADPEIAPLVDAVLGSVSETVMLRGSTPLGDRAQVVAEVLDGEGVGICHVEGRPSGSSGGGEGPGDGGKSLFELIRCDPIYRATLRRIFGNVEVVENLATALERRARSGGGRRFVTRDGILVEPWGGILLPGRNGGGLVSRRAEIEQLQGRMGVLEDELLHARDQGTALERSIDARMGELRGAREEIQRLRLDREHLERRLGENRRESERSRERIEVIKVEIREMDAERERILEALSEVRKGLEGVGEERARLEREVAEGEERLASLNERATEVEERVSGLRVESSQREERLVSLRREEHRILAEVRDRGERLDHIEEEEREARRRLAEHAEEERELRTSEEDLERSLAGLEERASQAEREVETRNRDLDEAEELAAGARVREEELRERREGDLIQESECRMKIEAIRGGLAEELEIDLSTAPVADWREELRREAGEPEGLEELLRLLTEELERVQDRLRRNASVNLEAVKELEELEERNRFLAEQIDDLQGSRKSLLDTIEALNRSSRERFVEAFEVVRGHFRDVFASIFSGGSADLRLEEGVDLLEAGVEVVARPPGKRISSLGLLSGGEKALTAISVLFALFRTKPSPFCILDEVDAPLDESNIRRFVRVLMEFAESSQFLIITHSKVTMAEAERLYGVTMEEEGVSRKVAVRLEEVESFQERASSPTGVPI